MEANVNIETIKRLADEVGQDTVYMLFTVFSDELEQYLKQLSSNPTVHQVGEIGHAVKSSAASFGADDLALIAQECEHRAKQDSSDWLIEHLPKFKQMVEVTLCKYRQLAGGDELNNCVL